MDKTYRAIGLMTGTSVDGIDGAIIETDGHHVSAIGPCLTKPFSGDLRRLLKDVLLESQSLKAGFQYTNKMREAERHLTLACASVVVDLIQQSSLARSDYDVIGFHGQTIVHRPLDPLKPSLSQTPFTCQLGNGVLLAQLTGIDVVCDFRAADVEAGGQGAPFAPAYHQALVQYSRVEFPVAVVNIGGIANVTFVAGTGETDLIAFDTGPGNGVIDDWIMIHSGMPCDINGQTAASGCVHQDILGPMLDHPYYEMPPPKSLDRYDFDLAPTKGLSLQDGAATLTALTANSIALAIQHLPEAPKRWIVCGGGRLNAELMKQLEAALCKTANQKVRLDMAEDVGWDGDSVEAQACAFLAVRALEDLPLSFPQTTGVPLPMRGGTHIYSNTRTRA